MDNIVDLCRFDTYENPLKYIIRETVSGSVARLKLRSNCSSGNAQKNNYGKGIWWT